MKFSDGLSHDVYGFALVSLPDSILTIGGMCPVLSSLPKNYIMRYKIDQWTKIGELISRRRAHNAFQNGDKIFIIGGLDWADWATHRIDNSTWGT